MQTSDSSSQAMWILFWYKRTTENKKKPIESVKTKFMEKGRTVLLDKNKYLLERWK